MDSMLNRKRGNEELPEGALRLCGGIGSPYSNKMLMILRYRRIPYRWIMVNAPEAEGLADPPGPRLLPKLIWPDGTAMNDSTFLIKRLEEEHISRSILPEKPGLRFICDLLEDFADEFVTKCMFHYRWVYDPDFAAEGIALQQVVGPSIKRETLEKLAQSMKTRQVGRLAIVGSNKTTGPIIEDFYENLIRKLDAHLEAGYPFLLGSRPSAADFAFLGQLHPMITLDPNTSSKTRDLSARVCAWYNTSFDLSGLSIKDESAETVYKYYIPFLKANAKALNANQKQFSFEIQSGVKWEQPTFKYQAKCLQHLQDAYAMVKDDPWLRKECQGLKLDLLLHNESPTAKL